MFQFSVTVALISDGIHYRTVSKVCRAKDAAEAREWAEGWAIGLDRHADDAKVVAIHTL